MNETILFLIRLDYAIQFDFYLIFTINFDKQYKKLKGDLKNVKN